jgi:hypothetical protein
MKADHGPLLSELSGFPAGIFARVSRTFTSIGILLRPSAVSVTMGKLRLCVAAAAESEVLRLI